MQLNRPAGFSLIELLIAMAISTIIAAAIAAVFVTNTKVKAENDRLGQQVENGRFAMDMLTQDLRLAGFWWTLDRTLLPAAPSTLPDPCVTTNAALEAAMPVHIQGYDGGAGFTPCNANIVPKTGSDILVIRRVGTCAAGASGCSAFIADAPYLQASQCAPSQPTASAEALFKVRTASADLDLRTLNPAAFSDTSLSVCSTTLAPMLPYYIRIYFVSDHTTGSDGIPALKMAELGAGGFNVITLASGIEQLQIEYGLDGAIASPATAVDSVPELYTPDPAIFPASGYYSAQDDTVGRWRNVVAARINLLSRNTTSTPEYTNNRSYRLGDKLVSGALVDNDVAVNDSFRRQAYTSVVRLVNVRN
jgi:type IV pilus assembly protein PilW